MKRVGTITRHLTHGYTAPSNTNNADAGQVRTGPKLSYEEVTKLSVKELQERFGKAPADGLKTRGVNHVAFVSADMARTLWFWCEVLGFRLVKTLELPGDGQHFFIDGGNDCAIAYFYFPNAPKAVPGVSSIDVDALMTGKGFATAHGSVNHVAFNVSRDKLREYRKRILEAGVGMVSPILYHSDKDPSGYSKTRDENTVWESIYFVGPDNEYLEFAAQTEREFTPEQDILHKPAIGNQD